MSFTEENRQELADKGYTVVRDLLTDSECNELIGQFQEWLKTNFEDGEFPYTAHSLVQRYKVGHLEPAWRARLKSRDVFAQIWGTNRLLTSVDAVAIGRPPEDGDETFANPDTYGWLHLDQTARRQGLHAYQGAVYLEHADHDDWTFEVLENSHRYFDEYYGTHLDAQRRALARGHMKTRDEHLDWLKEQGCVQKRVPVPKGGMILWDSRLVHANARPLEGRKHPGRWRWVVIACMAPACWAGEKALKLKRQAYKNLLMTTHWPCDDIGLFPAELPSFAPRELHPLKQLPEIARSIDAQRLMGVVPYPGLADEKEKEREEELLAGRPKWHPLYLPADFNEARDSGIFGVKFAAVVICGAVLLLAILLRSF